MDRALIALARAAVALAHVYSTALLGRSLVARLTPRPRYEVATDTFAGASMRVGWWRPGRGSRHPALLLVIGAIPPGLEFPELRLAADALARAGYLVMIPELPFMIEDRLDPDGPAQVASAFAALRAHPAAAGSVAAIGFSVGGGVLLAAAGREPELAGASALAVLGAYFDLRTYVASAVSRTQMRDGQPVPWAMSSDVPGRIAAAAERLAGDPSEHAPLARVLAAATFAEALARSEALPGSLRERFDRLSPSAVWDRVAMPVFWLHDERDPYVPVAEAFAARAASPRPPRLRVLVLRLLEHAVPVAPSVRALTIRTWVADLGRMAMFVASFLRAAAYAPRS